jgi:hypothetical protein
MTDNLISATDNLRSTWILCHPFRVSLQLYLLSVPSALIGTRCADEDKTEMPDMLN